jgi:hypothetical protein
MRDLAASAAGNPNVRFQTLKGSHGLVFEQPAAIVEMTLAFLGSERPNSDLYTAG